MPSYSYVARDAQSGKELTATMDASTEQAAIAALLNRNLLVISIEEKVGKKGKTAGGTVPLADLVVLTRQFATMIYAGLAMVQ
jgi:type II secretory pathway component PulF